VEDIAGLYISALERHQRGERTISIDEMTGIQATERLEKDLPMQPGKVERRLTGRQAPQNRDSVMF
jgi:putative transposase